MRLSSPESSLQMSTGFGMIKRRAAILCNQDAALTSNVHGRNAVALISLVYHVQLTHVPERWTDD